jgi:hypothetical protein
MGREVGLLHGIASTGQTQSAVRRFCRRYDLIDDLHSLFCTFFEKTSDLIGFYCIFAAWHIDWLFVFRYHKNTEFQLIMQVFMPLFLYFAHSQLAV